MKWVAAVFAVIIAVVLARWWLDAVSPADFARLPLNAIETVEVRTCGMAQPLPRQHWPELLARIGRAKSAPFVGWNGESWRTFETIGIGLRGRGQYALEFATRPSLHGTVLFNLLKLEGSGFSSYGHYRSDDLRTWLLQLLHLEPGTAIANCDPHTTRMSSPRSNTPLQPTSGAAASRRIKAPVSAPRG
jgi:hypothetical protein